MRLLAFGAALGAALASLFLLSTSHADAATPPGLDVSWPQCDKPLPVTPLGFVVVGVDGGKAFTTNSCFARQYRWASSSGTMPSLYMTLRSPQGSSLPKGMSGPYGTCSATNDACIASNYGYNAAKEAYAHAQAQVLPAASTMWWLDIETQSHWSKDKAANAKVVQGAIDYLNQKGVPLGIYSTKRQWFEIVGNFSPGLPNWIAGAHDAADAPTMCIPSNVFGGGTLWMVQYIANDLDHNHLCGESIATTLLTRSVTSSMIVTMAAKAAALPEAVTAPTPEARSIPAPPPPPIELSHVGGVGLPIMPAPANSTPQPCTPRANSGDALTQAGSQHDMTRERSRIPLKSRRRRTVGAE
jgi:hypothetical protein